MSTSLPAFGRFRYDVARNDWWLSEELTTMLGIDPATVSAPHLLTLLHPADADSTAEKLRRALADGGAVVSGLCRIISDGSLGTRRQGSQITVAYVADLVAEQGRPPELHGYLIDVSEESRDAADAAVRAATAHRAAIEQVKGLLVYAYGVDEDGAFDILRRYSNAAKIPLSRLARRAMELLEHRPDANVARRVAEVLQLAVDEG